MKAAARRKLTSFTAIVLAVGVLSATRADDYTLPGGSSPAQPGDPGRPGKDQQPPLRNDGQGGEPVLLHSGEYRLTSTDVRIPARGLPITISRTYRSLSNYNSRFGYGWDLNVNMKVRELANGDAMLLDGESRRHAYHLEGSAFVSPAGRYDSLVKNIDATFTLTDKHGVRHEFDENGNLSTIVDRNGNALAFAYDPGGVEGLFPLIGASNYFVDQTRGLVAMEYKLIRITDATGREVALNYNADGLLTTITDFAGRMWTYAYDPNTNDLLSVTAPATPEFPAGTTTTYTYGDHRLTSITDAKGQTYLVNQYDAQGRVSVQNYAGHTYTFAYAVGTGLDGAWEFNTDGSAEGWTVTSQLTPFIVANGLLYTGYTGTDPQMSGPTLTLAARANHKLTIRYRVTGTSTAQVYWKPPGGQWSADCHIDFNVVGDGEFHTYELPIGTHPQWTGTIAQLRFDPAVGGTTGDLALDRIRVGTQPDNPQTTVTDPRGVQTRTTCNAAGNPIEIVTFTQGWRPGDPPSYTTTHEYNAGSEGTRAILPRGNQEVMTYDDLGNLLSHRLVAAPGFTDPDIVTTYTYEPNFNFVQTITDPRGYVTSFAYDAHGNLTSVTQPEVGGQTPVWQFTYSEFGQVDTATDPEGMVTKYEYDPATGYLVRVTRNFGGSPSEITEYAYDAVGNVTAVTDANGHTTMFVYNDQNKLTQKIAPSPFNYLTNYGYDVNGNLISVARQNPGAGDGWQTTTYTYTVRDEVETGTDDMGHTTTYAYDGNGNLTSVTDAENHTTAYDYDERNLLWKVTNALDYVTEYGYDHNGRLASLKDARGNTTLFASDGFGRPWTTTYPDGSTEVRGYDPAGNLTSFANRRQQVIVFTYDVLNRRSTKTPPDAAQITYTYDRVGRLLTAVNDQGTIQHAFDDLGRLVQVVDAADHLVGYEYDALGNRRKLVYPDGYYVTYLHDALNRLTDIRDPLPATPADFDHDDDVDFADFTHLAGCLAGPGVVPGSGCADADLDSDGDVDLTDAVLFQRSFGAVGATVVHYDYDTLSRRTAALYGNGTSATYTYDDADRLQGLVNHMLPTDLSYAYTHDAVGNRLTMTVNGTQVHTYGYDPTYQLTSAHYPEGFFRNDTTYSYDSVGNRASVVSGGQPTLHESNNLNQYTTVGGVPFQYDPAGNLTGDGINTYSFDSENRLVSATTPARSVAYAYDPFGRQTTVTRGGEPPTIVTSVSDDFQVITEYVDSGDYHGVRRYVHGTGIDEPVRLDQDLDSPCYFHFDGLGSVIALTDSGGQAIEQHDYDVYGVATNAEAGVNRRLFTGRQYDRDIGRYHYRARDYAPVIGRFAQTEPLGYALGANLYSYVANNPVSLIDPLGLCKDEMPWWEKLEKGYYFGTGLGQEALDYFGGRWSETGNWLYVVPGFFAALWTPDTYQQTAWLLVGEAAWGRLVMRFEYWHAARQLGRLPNSLAGMVRHGRGLLQEGRSIQQLQQFLDFQTVAELYGAYFEGRLGG